jgi:hypothetical protein
MIEEHAFAQDMMVLGSNYFGACTTQTLHAGISDVLC